MSDLIKNIDPYEQLCQVAETEPVVTPQRIDSFSSQDLLAEKAFNERFTAALTVLLEMAVSDDRSIERVDKVLIDSLIVKIDEIISLQMDEIIHHNAFQELESLWSSLVYLVENTNSHSNVKIQLIDVAKETLKDDFEGCANVEESGLYRHVYISEYDTPGGEPYTAMIAPYHFDASPNDLLLLRNISKVASSSHCPFIGNVSGEFFRKSDISEITAIEDLESYMERAEYIRWNAFRETEDARYIGLTLPRFLLRLPYGENNRIKTFQYEECVNESGRKSFLWGASSFALGANLIRSFKKHGWCVNIRGPESGGKIEGLPMPEYDIGSEYQKKIPTELLFSETREMVLSELGLIPLSYYKHSDFACFFSANSTQHPVRYENSLANANSKINARLPYVFLSSRLAHYLKVIQRENIGSNKTWVELECELNDWLQTLVTKMNNPSPEVAASHPLKAGKIKVTPLLAKPGFYHVSWLYEERSG